MVCTNEIFAVVQDCTRALGMKDGRILDSQISATVGNAKQGRLNAKDGWTPVPSDSRQFLEVDLTKNTNITAVAAQGARTTKGFVQKYKVEYSRDCKEPWTVHGQFDGNEHNAYIANRDYVVKNQLDSPFIAKCVRIRPENWSYRIGLRIELYGCMVDELSPFS